MNIKNLTILVLCSLGISSCSLSETLEKGIKMEAKTRGIIEANSDCYEVSIIEYQITNGVIENVVCKLVGCKYETPKLESDKIVEILKDSIDGFCEIKNFSLMFVGKQETKIVKYWKCNFMPY